MAPLSASLLLSAACVAGCAAGCERAASDLAAIAAEARQTGGAPAECVRDDDCVLLPSALTCCVECPPAPPFEPAPRWVLDGLLIQSETDCAERDRGCPEVRCVRVPESCVAHAACESGRCVAVATGCEAPTS